MMKEKNPSTGLGTRRLVILDTHAILHRAYHALPDFSSSKGEPTGALYGLITMLLKIIGELKPDYIVAAFDLPEPTHRHLAFAEYKAQRAKADDALVAQIIRSRDVLDALGVVRYECAGFEADDVIGTIVEELKDARDIDVIIASGDMDTLQLVDDSHVRAYTLRKGLTDTVLYDEEKVKERYGFGPEHIADYKGLRGDPSDNIPGVKGIGEKTATMLIVEFGTIENVYKALKGHPEKLVAAGIKQGIIQKLTEQEEQAEFSKELAIIRRDAPIDFVLPPMWREHVSLPTILDMLQEFEFRSLIPRIKTVLASGSRFGTQVVDQANPFQTYSEKGGVKRSQSPDSSEKVLGSPVQAGGQPGGPDYFLQESEKDSPKPQEDSLFSEIEQVDQTEFEQVALAVWVIDSNVTQPTLEDIYRVGKADNFAEAKQHILQEIKDRNLSFVYEKIELPLAPVLRSVESYGVRVDRAFLKKLSKTYHKELEKMSANIYKAAGGEFNINSPKQLGEVLFDRMGLVVKNQKKTATGARSTRESELDKMRELHPIIADILSYRELQKLLSTYIDVIPTLLDAKDRLHTSYIQAGTTTGRLASQNPNLQNIPIKTELGRAIRNGFVASEGMQLVSFDYSQIELRVAALLSNDPTLIDIFKNGRDVHTEVAVRVFHVEPSAVTYEQRRRAKVINFGIIYGMGVNALKESLGTSRADAQEFYDQYFAAFPRLAAYLEETKADAARLGYTETLFGRRRYFEGIKSPIPYVRAAAERMAINAPIQGTATADLIKLAMVEAVQWIEKEKLADEVHLLLQVHDELVFEVKEVLVESSAKKIKEIMEQVLSSEQRKGIPFKAEGKSGANWGDMQELRV